MKCVSRQDKKFNRLFKKSNMFVIDSSLLTMQSGKKHDPCEKLSGKCRIEVFYMNLRFRRKLDSRKLEGRTSNISLAIYPVLNLPC